MKQSLLSLYCEDIDAIANQHERQFARRIWLRAVIETLHERSMTDQPVPVRRRGQDDEAVVTERYLPFWRNLPDHELDALLAYIRPYFRRAENRGLKL